MPLTAAELNWLERPFAERADRFNPTEVGLKAAAEIRSLKAEVEQLKACLKPGRATAIVCAMFEDAIRLGFYKPNGEPASTQFVHEVERLRAELDSYRIEASVGCGTGNSNLYVHGSYEAIKAVQTAFLERAPLLARLKALEKVRDAAYAASGAMSSLVGANKVWHPGCYEDISRLELDKALAAAKEGNHG